MDSERTDGESESFKGLLQKGPLVPPLLKTKVLFNVFMALHQIPF